MENTRTTNRVPGYYIYTWAGMHACVNYEIYSGHGDTGLPDSTAGTHPGYMAKVRTLASTGGYQYNLAQASSAARSPDYTDSSYLGTPLAPASRSPGGQRTEVLCRVLWFFGLHAEMS